MPEIVKLTVQPLNTTHGRLRCVIPDSEIDDVNRTRYKLWGIAQLMQKTTPPFTNLAQHTAFLHLRLTPYTFFSVCDDGKERECEVDDVLQRDCVVIASVRKYVVANKPAWALEAMSVNAVDPDLKNRRINLENRSNKQPNKSIVSPDPGSFVKTHPTTHEPP